MESLDSLEQREGEEEVRKKNRRTAELYWGCLMPLSPPKVVFDLNVISSGFPDLALRGTEAWKKCLFTASLYKALFCSVGENSPGARGA
jgi:hypothetical protein